MEAQAALSGARNRKVHQQVDHKILVSMRSAQFRHLSEDESHELKVIEVKVEDQNHL